MSDELRRAAALLRERANDATPGPWRDSSTEPGIRYGALVADKPHPLRTHPDQGGWGYDHAYGGCLVGESLMSGDRACLAAVNPTVGLALADWLDEHASATPAPTLCEEVDCPAFRVARAILGETS